MAALPRPQPGSSSIVSGRSESERSSRSRNRHVTHVAELTTAEAAELGPLLQRTAAVASELLGPEQVYVTLWSHAGGTPGYIHWVVQPVTQEVMDAYEDYGPFFQVKMFERGVLPNPDAVEKFAASARTLFDD